MCMLMNYLISGGIYGVHIGTLVDVMYHREWTFPDGHKPEDGIQHE